MSFLDEKQMMRLYLWVGSQAFLPAGEDISEGERFQPLKDEVGLRRPSRVHLWDTQQNSINSLPDFTSLPKTFFMNISPHPTFAVLQRSLHGTLSLIMPEAPCRIWALCRLQLSPLPQVDLQTVVEQEQGWEAEDKGEEIGQQIRIRLDYLWHQCSVGMFWFNIKDSTRSFRCR